VRQFAWVDSSGVDTLSFAAAPYGPFALSPDGRKILVRVESANSRGELWILSLQQGTRSRVPGVEAPGYLSNWWPDGNYIVYTDVPWQRQGFGPAMRVSESGKVDTIVRSAYVAIASPDGRHIAVGGYTTDSGLWYLSTAMEGTPVRLASHFQSFASFSPDGRWIAYSDPAVNAVCAVEIEHPETRVQISDGGGNEPVWSRDGQHIFFRRGWTIMVVDVRRHEPRFSHPRFLLSGPFMKVPGRSHDVNADDRHLVLLALPRRTTPQLEYVTGWFAQLAKLAPAPP
jgi:Tol biopolymer transport system component